MIRVTVYKRITDQSFKGFRVLGHAEYADPGKDIVCAAVSALTTNFVNSVETFTDEKFLLRTDEERGLIAFKFQKAPGHDAVLFMRSWIMGLEAILQEHSDCIRLLFKEV
jgi:uncharacterized protein